jgi:hypothetical protein
MSEAPSQLDAYHPDAENKLHYLALGSPGPSMSFVKNACKLSGFGFNSQLTNGKLNHSAVNIDNVTGKRNRRTLQVDAKPVILIAHSQSRNPITLFKYEPDQFPGIIYQNKVKRYCD